MTQVAAIAEELEKIYPKAKSLIFVTVLSDRKGAIVLIQDCDNFQVASPLLNDNVVMMAQGVTPPVEILQYVKARCYVTIDRVGWIRVLTHLSAPEPSKTCFVAKKVAAAAYAILSTENA